MLDFTGFNLGVLTRVNIDNHDIEKLNIDIVFIVHT